jgi:hypothetical protein
MWLDTVVDSRTVLCVVDEPPASGEELLRRVLTEFGILNHGDAPTPAVTANELTQVLQRFLGMLRSLDARAFIVIENADGAADPTRAEIDRLSGLDPGVLEVLLVDASARAGTLKPRAAAIAAAAALVAVAVAGSLWMSRPTLPRMPPSHVDREPLLAARSPAGEAARLARPPADAPPAVAESIGAYHVLIGAFRDPSHADAVIDRLRELNLPVRAQLTPSGLRQVAIGPYQRRGDASTAITLVQQAGFEEATLVKIRPSDAQSTAEDRLVLARAEALARAHDVRGLIALRAAWRESSGSNQRPSSPTLTAIDRLLDTARLAQLEADRQLLLSDAKRR